MVEIKQRYMTNSDCYKANRKINIQGIMIHLTATAGVMAGQWFSRWNKPGVSACVHYFVDNKEAWKYLPDNHRGWHGGGSSNNTHIGIEGCEPAGHRYSGSTPVGYDVKRNEKYFNDMYNNLVELTVHLCKEHKLTEKDVIGHIEGGYKGIASRSADPEHLFKLHKKSMDIFRADVKRGLEGKSKSPTPSNNKSTSSKDELFRVQAGAFSNKNNATSLSDKLKKDGYNTYLIQVGNLYKVQVGAFSVRANANTLANELKKKGYSTFITTESGEAVSESKTTPQSTPPKIQSKPKANLTVDGIWGSELTKALQKEFGTPVDGIISGQYNNATTRSIYSVKFGAPYTGSAMIKALQKKLKVKADGFIGTETIKALQRHLGTPADGVISRPSTMVRELQKRLNAGTF